MGTTAFGGPAAHIAMMQSEFVDRRSWLDNSEFLDLVSASNLIPGPSSTELAIAIGYWRAGWMGLILTGICFILPEDILVGLLAALVVNEGQNRLLLSAMVGIEPVVVAIVGHALVTLFGKAINTWPKRIASIVGTGLSIFGVSPVMLLFGSGLIFAGVESRNGRILEWRPLVRKLTILVVLALLPLSMQLAPKAFEHPTPIALFLYFLKIGSVIYGSGYVLLTFLQAELVSKFHWLTSHQLIDAIAVGQFTPGPVFTTATFIGYILGGPMGAIVSTVGIFLPAFTFVWISGRSVFTLRQSPISAAFLDGVNCAAVALMASVEVSLIRQSCTTVLGAALALIGLVILLRTKINSAWLVLAGAIVGLLFSQ